MTSYGPLREDLRATAAKLDARKEAYRVVGDKDMTHYAGMAAHHCRTAMDALLLIDTFEGGKI